MSRLPYKGSKLLPLGQGQLQGKPGCRVLQKDKQDGKPDSCLARELEQTVATWSGLALQSGIPQDRTAQP